MLLRTTGSLILLDMERMVSTALLRNVERFWYAAEKCTPFNLIAHRPIWWVYGDGGIHVCFQNGIHKMGSSEHGEDDDDETLSQLSPSKAQKQSDEVERWFELVPEVYLRSIMSQYGMLLGATQGLATTRLKLILPFMMLWKTWKRVCSKLKM